MPLAPGTYDRQQVQVGDSGVAAARKKLLENLYAGENATTMPPDIPSAPAPTSQSARGIPDVRQRPDSGAAGGNSGFGPSTLQNGPQMPWSGGGTGFTSGGGGAPQQSQTQQVGTSSPDRSNIGASSAKASGGALAQQQANIVSAINGPNAAASNFVKGLEAGSRGGPQMQFQGTAWKKYSDPTNSLPAYNDSDNPVSLPPILGGGSPTNIGDPFGGQYGSVSPGGNNVRPAGLPAGNNYIGFVSSQSGAGSNRIQMATIGGVPVLRFQVNPGDSASNGNRAELIGPSDITPGSTRTYSLQSFIPNDFKGPNWGTFFQFHSPSATANSGGVGNWGIHFHGNTLGIYTNDGVFHPIGPAPIGKWTDYQMTVTFGTGSSGHIKLLMDGKVVFDQAANTIDGAGAWYLKQGYYRADTGTTGVIYSTPVRNGPSQNVGGLPQPGAGGAPGTPPPGGNPATAGGYHSVTGGGDNVGFSGIATGGSYVPWKVVQSAPGSDRIQMTTVNGQPVYRFQVNGGDRASNGNRTEFEGPAMFNAGSTQSFSFNTFIPQDFQKPLWGTFLQFHSPGFDNWGLHFTHSDWSDSDRISLWTLGDQHTGGWSIPIPRGQWMNFKMDVKFGANGAGHVTLYYNGQKVVDTDASTISDNGWYVKQGLYRGDDGQSATIYQTPLQYGSGAAPMTGTPTGGTPTGGGSQIPTSTNKMAVSQALTTINNTPGMWSGSYEPSYDKMYRITDNLFQSGAPLASYNGWAAAGFDLIVNTRDNTKYQGVQTINIPMNDSKPSQSEWNTALSTARTVADAIRAGKRVLVHCYAGANRSGLINALTLIQLGYTPQQALQTVRAGRPGAVSNTWFEKGILTGNPF